MAALQKYNTMDVDDHLEGGLRAVEQWIDNQHLLHVSLLMPVLGRTVPRGALLAQSLQL